MDTFFLQGLLLMGCILLAQGLVCHHCLGVTHPIHCNKTKTCEDSEVCFSEKVMNGKGELFHNSGCSHKEVCPKDGKKGLHCNGLRECVRFCDSDRCNRRSCLDLGYTKRRSCKDYKEVGFPSGEYVLDLHDGLFPVQVYCDMDTDGGGWTVFQRRKDDSVDFYRGWEFYKQGFGHLNGNFWLGNDHLHRLTKAGLTRMRVDLEDWTGNTSYAQYGTFRVGPLSDNYRLSVYSYRGTAGDSLAEHNGMAFSTKDSDHDNNKGNCAVKYIGGWWYNNCHRSGLNGVYYPRPVSIISGIVWMDWRGWSCLKFSEMKLREP